MTACICMAALQSAQDTSYPIEICFCPSGINIYAGELIMGDVVEYWTEIVESCRLGFIAEWKGLQAGVDLTFLQQAPTGWRTTNREYFVIATSKTRSLSHLFDQVSGSLLQRKHADTSAA